MCEVYANSHLTIAATGADNDAKGFLHPRPSNYVPSKLTYNAGKSTEIYVLPPYQGFPRRLTRMNNQPLDARAWTLQEYLLSARTLRFCSIQMTWKCKERVQTEAENGHPRYRYGYPIEKSSDWTWDNIVEELSGRAITYETDRLPALAGLAASVAELHGKKYCAGVWWDGMPQCLLWPVISHKRQEAPSKYLAPSWSWVFVNGHIYYPKGHGIVSKILESVVIHDCHTQTSRESPYGAVGGDLILKAPLAPLRKLLHSEFEFSHPENNMAYIFSFLDLEYEETREVFGLILACGNERGYLFGLLICRSAHPEDFARFIKLGGILLLE